MSLYALILAGGVGARFWPRSRQLQPKQFLSVFSENSLIQDTLNRIAPLVAADKVRVMTRFDQAHLLREQLPNLSEQQLVLEPFSRSTGPAIAVAARLLAAQDPEAMMLVLPSDHRIQDQPLFQETLSQAIEYVRTHDVLMTVGIQPSHPETGYGYLLFDNQPLQTGLHPLYAVRQFVEKPEIEAARRYVQSERYLWNSGMFIWKAKTLLAELALHAPELYQAVMQLPDNQSDPDFDAQLKTLYSQLESGSIDTVVLEKSAKVCVIKGFFGWSDVGSWESVYQLSPHDNSGNVVRGDAFTYDVSRSYIYTPQRFSALIGVSDLLVVDTEDALLICHRDRAQDVRLVVQHLESTSRGELC